MPADAERPGVTRFDASDPSARRELIADAVAAHRERDSAYLTVEADGGEPWLQYADGVCNLDCTDAELDRLETLLSSFPAFEVAELTSPETAEGTNVRVETVVGPDRLAQFVDRVFDEVYELPADCRLWVASV